MQNIADQEKKDWETYKTLLDLWLRENPIKTTKLQVLLAVNGLLISAVNIAGGFTLDKWSIYLGAFVFNLIWTFSIGRTMLYQQVWKIRLDDLGSKYQDDPRFRVLDKELINQVKKKASLLVRIFGGISSKWYLILSPICFALVWFLILVLTLFL